MNFCFSNYNLIVSLDFGNSFSGTCYAITAGLFPKYKEYTKIIHVTDWPKEKDARYKTPSISVYDKNFHLLQWGMLALQVIESGQLKETDQVVEKFKFDLPTSNAQKGAFRPTGNTSQDQLLNMRATIDYFREIFDHTLSVMESTNKTERSAQAIKNQEENIRFVITVPGQWNDVQRSLMRIIAIEAGLISEYDHENRFIIINESLATSLYCERKQDVTKSNVNDIGDRPDSKKVKYMICDAGGATISIAVFEMAKNGDKNGDDSLRRCQLTAGSVKGCGSVYLDLKMKEILLDICFGGDKSIWKDDKLKKGALELLIVPLTNQFLKDKINFGKAKSDFIPDCCREILEVYDPDDSHSDVSDDSNFEIPSCKICDFLNGHDEQFVEFDNFGDDTVFGITQGRILSELKFRKDLDGKIITDEGVIVQYDDRYCEIRLSYKYMRENVFDEVTNNALDFLRKQIKKANGNIARTYMAGGFGGSPYLCKRIANRFPIDDPLYVGNLIKEERGDTATMRGALIYGIDCSRKEPQSDVAFNNYEDSTTSQYNTLVCLDIGYSGTMCSYRDLRKNSDEMTEIINWPGSKVKNFIIPTAKETVDEKPLWGAQVKQPTNRRPESFVTLSKLMSAVKGNCKTYYIEFLKLVFEHVHNVITQEHPDLSDKNKYRYVITMENCYQFLEHKSEMREIAQMASIVNKRDPEKRLLLIRREDAAAMYFEKTIFANEKSDTNHILQINIYHDTCHMTLHESTKITGYNTSKDRKFRNVRSMRSATFEFNFFTKLVTNLSVFVSNSFCCKDQKSHDTTKSAYIFELRGNFLEYLRNKLDFNSCKAQVIKVTKSPGCQISITNYEIMEYVFWPAIRELTSAIKCNGMQRNVFRLFKIERVFLFGLLPQTKKETYDFLKKIIIKNLSEVLNMPKSIISLSNDDSKEALMGAAYYGNHPEDFTERVSRRSYFVQVRGYKRQEFEMDIKRNISKIEMKGGKSMKHDVYNEEAANAFIDESKEVNLYYQSSRNPSLKSDSSLRGPSDVTLLIGRGDKISEHNQMHGISKRFYAEEECIAYATIYTSEDTLPEDEVKVDLTNLNKIHQFELYIKRDKDDPTTSSLGSRLHFDIHLKIDKEESRFEAFVCSKLGNKSPEFRFDEQFLVANIYNDEDRIKIEDLYINKDNS